MLSDKLHLVVNFERRGILGSGIIMSFVGFSGLLQVFSERVVDLSQAGDQGFCHKMGQFGVGLYVEAMTGVVSVVHVEQ
jgi:hypothetical protein